MKSIRIKNLRSLQDTGEMEIKPINILVGLNSSGKSTFLRFFPLMKQSLRRKVNGPILWSGEDDYVDFGSFDEAVNNNAKEKKISFKFSLKVNNIVEEYSYKFTGKNKSDYDKSGDVDIEISLSKCKNNFFDYISKLVINILGHEFSAKIAENGKIESAKINNKNYPIEYKEKDQQIWDIIDDFSSPFYVKLDILEESVSEYINDGVSLDESYNVEAILLEYITMQYLFLKKIVGLDVDIPNGIGILSNKQSVMDFIKKYEEKKHPELESNEILMMHEIRKIYGIISDYLSIYFRNIYYIAPVRATAERYYRLRNTAVDEVDCRGKNLAIFLNSLNEDLFRLFQEWTNENLGFKVEKNSSEGYVSLKISKKNSKNSINLSDTGFGYSQILPIITQLWYINIKKNDLFVSKEGLSGMRTSFKNIPITITIEQPELHLHPSLQAKLVDIIAKVLESTNKKINFVIETHSETVINRLGNLIYKEKIQNEDVAIFIFDKDSGNKDTNIKLGKFDKEGYLEDWPVGFFEPEEVF